MSRYAFSLALCLLVSGAAAPPDLAAQDAPRSVRVSTFAEYPGEAGPENRFSVIMAMTRSAGGDLYVLDQIDPLLRRIDSKGRVFPLPVSPLPGVDPYYAGMQSPRSILWTPDGSLLVLDSSRLIRIEPNGQARVLAGSEKDGKADGIGRKAAFYRPRGFALGPDGGVYISDAGNLRICRVSPEGEVATLVEVPKSDFRAYNAGTALFAWLDALTLRDDGSLAVLDGHRLRLVAPDGGISLLAGSGAMDEAELAKLEGIVYADRIYAGNDGRGEAAGFKDPGALCAGPKNSVFVADHTRIRWVQEDGTVTTLAGTTEPGYQDGPGADARFDTISALAWDGRSTLYAADAGNKTLRALDIQW